MSVSHELAAVKPSAAIAEAVKRVDWSFHSELDTASPSTFDIRQHHWYPATFVPLLPRTLIEILTRPRAMVYDPFGGIGTTVFQALHVGRRAQMSEINEIATRVARAILMALARPSSSLPDVQRLHRKLAGRKAAKAGRDDSGFVELGTLVEDLGPWFHPQTFRDISLVADAIVDEPNELHSELMFVALSGSLMGLTAGRRRRKGWGYIADNVRPSEEDRTEVKDGVSRFVRQLQALCKGVRAMRETLAPDVDAYLSTTPLSEIVRREDSSQNSSKEPLDLVLTSPPYPGMADYSTSQRLSFYLVGKRPEAALSQEIGARRHRRRASLLADYRAGIVASLGMACSRLRPGGYACLVLPSYAADEVEDARTRAVDAVLGDLHGYGMAPVLRLERRLPLMRRHHNEGWSTLNRECIHIYVKEA